MSEKRSRFGQLRSILRVARTYATQPIKGKYPRPWLTFSGDPKAYRRAFVEASLVYRPAEVVTRDGVNVLEVNGTSVAVSAGGRMLTTRTLSTSPISIRDLVERASSSWRELLSQRLLAHGVTLGAIDPALESIKQRFARPFVIGAVKRFLATIDPEAVKLARRFWLTDPECLEWLTPACAELSLRRRQALQLFPLLVLAAKPWSVRACGVAWAIDAAAPLVPAMARQFGVRPATIKRLAGATPQRFLPKLGYVNHIPFEVLDALPPQLFPTNRRQMAAVRNLASLASGNWRHQPLDLGSLVRRIPTAIPLDRQPLISSDNETRSIHDMIQSAERHLAQPQAFFNTLGLSALKSLSEDWHREVIRVAAETHCDASWPSGFEPFRFERGGLRLVELTTATQLAGEGTALGHCVGNYASACLSGRSRILSVRGEDGLPISTVEINQKGRVVQHCAKHNTTPPREAAELVQHFLGEIAAGRIVILDQWPVMERHGLRQELDLTAFWQRRAPAAALKSTEDTLQNPFPDEALIPF